MQGAQQSAQTGQPPCAVMATLIVMTVFKAGKLSTQKDKRKRERSSWRLCRPLPGPPANAREGGCGVVTTLAAPASKHHCGVHAEAGDLATPGAGGAWEKGGATPPHAHTHTPAAPGAPHVAVRGGGLVSGRRCPTGTSAPLPASPLQLPQVSTQHRLRSSRSGLQPPGPQESDWAGGTPHSHEAWGGRCS